MQTNHSKLKQNGFTNKCNMRSERCHTPGWDPFRRRSPLVCRTVVVPCYGAQLCLPPAPQVAVSRMLFSVFVQKLRFSIVGALVSPRYPTKKMESRHLYKVKLCTPPLNHRKSAIKSENTPPLAQTPSTKNVQPTPLQNQNACPC